MDWNFLPLLNVLASLGLCFAGTAILSINLAKMTSSYLYKWILAGTKSRTRSFVFGVVINAVVNKTSAFASILASMVSAGIMKMPNAIAMLIGGNIGSFALLYIISFNINSFILFFMGISGIWFGFVKEGQGKYTARAFFGISLLLYGIFFMRGELSPEYLEQMRSFFMTSGGQYYFPCFLIGWVAQLVLQAGTILIIIQMQLLETGTLDLGHILFIQCGTRFGSMLLTIMNNMHFQGTARKLVVLQLMLNVVGITVCILLFYVEQWTGFPLMIGIVEKATASAHFQVVNLALYYTLVSTLILIVGNKYFLKLMDRLVGPEKDDPTKVKYIQNAPINDPTICIPLVNKEQIRVMENLYGYIQYIRHTIENEENKNISNQKNYYKLNKEIENFLKKIQEFISDKHMFDCVLNLIHQNITIEYLGQTLGQFRIEISAKASEKSHPCRPIYEAMIEAFDIITYTAIETMKNSSPENIADLFNVTNDRTALILDIEKKILEKLTINHEEIKSEFILLAGYFERFVWLSRELAICIQKELAFNLA